MADPRRVETLLTVFLHPSSSPENAIDLTVLQDEWVDWTTPEETDAVFRTLRFDPHPSSQRLLALYLHAVDTPRSRERLRELIVDSDPKTREETFACLERFRKRETVLFLLDLIGRAPLQRDRTLLAIQRAATQESARDLRAALEAEPEPAVVTGLLYALRKVHDVSSVRMISRLLSKTTDDSVRSQALYTLGHLNAPAVRKTFVKALGAKSPGVRRAAVFGLTRVGGTFARRILIEALGREGDPAVFKEILQVFLRDGWNPEAEDVRALAGLAPRTESPSLRWRVCLIAAAWRDRLSEKERRALVRWAETRDPRVAAVILGDSGSGAPGALQKTGVIGLADQHPLFQERLAQIAEGGAGEEFTGALSSRLRAVTIDAPRTTRLLAARCLSRSADPADHLACFAILRRDPEPRVREAALRGCLRLLEHPDSASAAGAKEMVVNPRFIRTFFKAVALAPLIHGTARRGLMRRLLCSSAFASIFESGGSAGPVAARWIVLARALAADYENDLLEILAEDGVREAARAPVLRALESLLTRDGRRIDAGILLPRAPEQPETARLALANLLRRQERWGSGQARQAAAWLAREPSPEIRGCLERALADAILAPPVTAGEPR